MPYDNEFDIEEFAEQNAPDCDHWLEGLELEHNTEEEAID